MRRLKPWLSIIFIPSISTTTTGQRKRQHCSKVAKKKNNAPLSCSEITLKERVELPACVRERDELPELSLHWFLMDQIFNKVGSYWLGQQANKEFASVGSDINSLSNSIEGGAKWLVNKVKGKMQKPLPELLKEYDLAIGIFPRDATNYEFNEETKKLTVYIPSMCEVGYKDSSVLRFSNTVTGYLEKGKLADIEGIKTKFIIWVKVTCITSENSKLHFTAGMKKTRSRDAYEVLRDGVGIDKF